MNQYVKLGVNIDHVATLQNARGGQDPILLQMALAVEEAGADGKLILKLLQTKSQLKMKLKTLSLLGLFQNILNQML